MRLPFIQLASRFVSADAPEIAARLRLRVTEVLGMGVVLFAYAVDKTSVAGEAPDGILRDPDAAVVLERMMGWRGEPGRCMDAFAKAGVVEFGGSTLRIRGMKRYRAAWDKAAKERDRKRKSRSHGADGGSRSEQLPQDGATVSAPLSAGHPRDVPWDVGGKTYTETYTEKEDVVREQPRTAPPPEVETAPPSDLRPFRLEAPKAKRPRKPSAQEQLAARLSAQRHADLGPDAVPDKSYGPSRLNRMLQGPVERGVDPEALAEAHALWLRSPRALALDPPAPLWAFAEDWPQWVSKLVRSAGEAPP